MGNAAVDERSRDDPEESAPGSRDDGKMHCNPWQEHPDHRADDHRRRRPRKVVRRRFGKKPGEKAKDVIHEDQLGSHGRGAQPERVRTPALDRKRTRLTSPPTRPLFPGPRGGGERKGGEKTRGRLTGGPSGPPGGGGPTGGVGPPPA